MVENLRDYCNSINRTIYISVERKPTLNEKEKLNEIGSNTGLGLNHSFWNIRYSPDVYNEIKQNKEHSPELIEKIVNDETSRECRMKIFNSMHWFTSSFSYGYFGVYPTYAVNMDKLNNPPDNPEKNEE